MTARIGRQIGVTVGDDVVWESILGEYMFKEQFGKLQSIVCGVAGDEECLFGESANDNKDCIKAFRVRELNNMVHQNKGLGAVTNGEGSQHAIGAVAGYLVLEA
ncbi:hypothetical protein C0989_002208 [Termitomyces sp. Mn162]|nr:hypothetical protein C0989_002208 [Termitomyces sp. Mn162]